MSDEVLRDRTGNMIGRIETAHDGKQTIRDRSGNRLGSYDPRENKTRDKTGNIVGSGNLLTTLLR